MVFLEAWREVWVSYQVAMWTSGSRSYYLRVKEISPGCSVEGMMLKLKLQYFGIFCRLAGAIQDQTKAANWPIAEAGINFSEVVSP